MKTRKHKVWGSIFTLLFCVSLLLPAITMAQSGKSDGDPAYGYGIYPVLTCVEDLGTGMFKAKFGVVNNTGSIRDIPIREALYGPDYSNNYFTSKLVEEADYGFYDDPFAAKKAAREAFYDQGQGDMFEPGSDYLAFEVEFPEEDRVCFNIGNGREQNRACASVHSRRCGYVFPFVNCVTKTMKKVEVACPCRDPENPCEDCECEGCDDLERLIPEITVHYGYVNTGEESVELVTDPEPDGDENAYRNCIQFASEEEGPVACDQGQPTIFAPGQHDNAVAITNDGALFVHGYCGEGGCNDQPFPTDIEAKCKGDCDHECHEGCWTHYRMPRVMWRLRYEPCIECDEQAYPEGIFGKKPEIRKPGCHASWCPSGRAEADLDSRACNVKPLSNCIKKGCSIEGETGNWEAWFGYRSSEKFPVNIPVGPTNLIFPRPDLTEVIQDIMEGEAGYNELLVSQNQPEIFLPGKHDKAFGVCFNKSELGAFGWEALEGKSVVDKILDAWHGEHLDMELADGFELWTLPDFTRLGLRIHRPRDFLRRFFSINLVDATTRLALHYNVSILAETFQSTLCNRLPVCDAGGEYLLPCTGNVTNVFLTGNGSSDPDGDGLSYAWDLPGECEEAVLFPAQSANPVVSMTVPGIGIPQTCQVQLTVTEDSEEGLSSSCQTTVAVNACDLPEPEPTPDPGATAQGATPYLCQYTDISGSLQKMYDAAKEQLRINRKSIRAIQRKRLKATASLKLLNTTKKLARANKALAWDLPALNAECEGTGCVSMSSAGPLSDYMSNATELLAISEKIGRRMKKAGLRKRSRNFAEKIAVLSNTINLRVDEVPASTDSCQ